MLDVFAEREPNKFHPHPMFGPLTKTQWADLLTKHIHHHLKTIWSIVIMRTHKVSILAIGAHPDDMELSCSGTILTHIAQGYTAATHDLTHSELGTRGDATTRLAESKTAAAILGVAHRDEFRLQRWVLSKR